MNAIYAGSFDPFTNGHMDIVKQAVEIFDKLYVVIAVNSSKNRKYDIQQGLTNLMYRKYKDKVEIFSSNRLIADIAEERNCTYLVRGLRNPNDYNYEENIAKINREINPNLKTIYFRADNDVISSSFIREIYSQGKDISKYVDPEILKYMEMLK